MSEPKREFFENSNKIDQPSQTNENKTEKRQLVSGRGKVT